MTSEIRRGISTRVRRVGAFLSGLCFLAAGVMIVGCPPQFVEPPGATVRVQVVAQGLTSPVGLAAPRDGSGRLFIVDQVGLVRVVDGGGNLLATPFLDLSSAITPLNPTADERGVLSLAFHPEYATNGRFFVSYTAPKGADIPAEFDCEWRLSEFRAASADSNTADANTERILLRVGKPQANHNGGQLAFGADGLLYASVGDGGGANDEGAGHNEVVGNGQDRSTLLGKLLRIDVDSGDPYGIPADNPFVGVAGAAPEIWAYGLRNPWRFSFDAGDARRLFLGDVGQDLFEEIDLIVRGGNYGWRIREGLHCFDPFAPGDPPADCATVGANGEPLIDPILEFAHTGANGEPLTVAVVGGYVYRGAALGELAGDYIFGHYTTTGAQADGRILVGEEQADGTWLARELVVEGGEQPGKLGRFILAFGQDGAGEVYVLTSANFGPVGESGVVYRLVKR